MNKLQTGTFTITEEIEYTGMYDPEMRWNDFYVPLFTLETAFQVLEDSDFTSVEYNAETDTFSCKDEYYDEYTYSGIDVDGTIFYAIGGFEWAWELS